MRRTTALISLFIALTLCAAPTAFAGALTDAKASGEVGERLDGYTGAVKASPSAAIAALVADTNAKRKQHYAAIAKKNGTTVSAVAGIAGRKLVERTKSGGFIKRGDGPWTKHP